VLRRSDRMIVQGYRDDKGERQWDDWITVYPVDDPPWACPPARIGQPRVPECWEPLEGVKPDLGGVELLREAERLLGDDGTVGVMVGLPAIGGTEDSIYRYYDDYDGLKAWARQSEELTVELTEWLMTLSPQHLVVGNSGIMTYEGPEIFTDISLPTLKAVTRIAKEHDVPTHLHACGKERELVRIAVADSDLSGIEPLEPPPMGDCDLAEIKRTFGKHIALKGNLHTTDVMLRGTPDEVEAACKWCIDVAAEGGGYILSTGDQCGRDTPDENMHRMIDVGRGYGKY
jgi:uroporphyrinogen decarboxylase